MAPLFRESVAARDILSRLAPSAPAHINPTRTLSEVASKVLPRQAVTTTVVSEGGGGNMRLLSGGAIAGIVIGSIVGFLLLLWILRACTNLGHSSGWGQTFEPAHEKPAHHHHHSAAYPYHHETHRSRSRRGRNRSHSHSHSHSHSPHRTVEVRPVYYAAGGSRGRSPRAPPPVYPARDLDGRDLRRASGSRGYR